MRRPMVWLPGLVAGGVDAPTALAVTSEGNASVGLSWTVSGTGGVTHQRIYRAVIDTGAVGTLTLLHTIADNTTNTYTDDGAGSEALGINNDEAYFYVIRAFDGAEESDDSNMVFAVPRPATMAAIHEWLMDDASGGIVDNIGALDLSESDVGTGTLTYQATDAASRTGVDFAAGDTTDMRFEAATPIDFATGERVEVHVEVEYDTIPVTQNNDLLDSYNSSPATGVRATISTDGSIRITVGDGTNSGTLIFAANVTTGVPYTIRLYVFPDATAGLDAHCIVQNALTGAILFVGTQVDIGGGTAAIATGRPTSIGSRNNRVTIDGRISYVRVATENTA